MNRRNFLRSGGLAAIAVTGLPNAVRSMGRQSNDPTTYRMVPTTDSILQTVFEISLYHNAVSNFKTATDEEKIIIIKAAKFSGTDFSTPDTKGEFRYKLKKSEKSTDNANEWIITTKFDKKLSGDFAFEKDYPKSPKLTVKLSEYVEIMSKEGYILDKVPFPATSSSGTSGCFLTTACVTHKQLADDCFELQQLRNLRDQFMLVDTDGKKLVDHYYSIGPSIVKAINSCDNKAAIYDYMYANMILPSVELAAQGEHAAAVKHYQLFVKALAEKYN